MKYLIIFVVLCFFCRNIDAQSDTYNKTRDSTIRLVNSTIDYLEGIKVKWLNSLEYQRGVANRYANGNESKVENYTTYIKDCATRNNINISDSLFYGIETCVGNSSGREKGVNRTTDASQFVVTYSINNIQNFINESLYVCEPIPAEDPYYEVVAISCYKAVTYLTKINKSVGVRQSEAVYKISRAKFVLFSTLQKACLKIANSTLTTALRAYQIYPSKC